jgi:Xaa-Pro aminopeptidase
MTTAMPYGWGRVTYSYEDRLRWQILPFPNEEYEERIARLREVLVQEELDCLLVFGTTADPANVRYLTNFDDLYGGETVVVVPLDGDVVLVTNAVMHGEPMHSGVPQVWPQDVRAAAAPRTVTGRARAVTVADHVRSVIAALGREAVIGLEGDWREELLVELDLVDAARVRPRLRLVHFLRTFKSPREVDLLRKAAALADDAVTAAMTTVKAGVSEYELAAVANEAMFRGGAEHPAFPLSLVAGPRAGLKHLPPSDYRVKDGDLVFIDVGARYMGYLSDCSRETVCGGPTSEQLRFMETQATIVEAVAAAIKPGCVIGDAAAIAHDLAGDAGYEEYLYFRGHGVGTGFTELPALAPGNPATFEAGMVFALEPMLVRLDFGTACWEDVWHVTESGVERLNRSTPRFWEMAR